ncbi:MAG: rod shape-determining protein RodA [bacterium]|nr:rod shape-determining protein RodA [bacterium]MCP4965927.1 rod shape-determining protein RodA [bacterium]
MVLTARRTEPVTLLQRERALRPDVLLILSYLALTGLGLVMIYSASAPRLLADGESPTSLVRRQMIFALVGIVAFVLASLIEHRTLKMLAPIAYVGSLISLIVVLYMPVVSGANRWIELGFFQFQPSELAKVSLILALAALLAASKDKALHWTEIARAVVLVAVPAFLIFRQPDLGTMLVFGFVAVVMVFSAGTTWRQFAFMTITAVLGSALLFKAGWIAEYQLTRITAFLDETSDVVDSNYNLIQSKIAIGSGGLFGRGLFEGAQTNLSFVPEQSTDFIFTAIGEQLGFVGATVVIGLFALITWRLLVAAANGRDRFSQLVAIGVAAMLVFHVFVNIGMTVRITPVTGLPLPFLSAGGTAFIAMSLALGLGHSVWMRRSPVPVDVDI